MSKILVDKMPEKPYHCPFAIMGNFVRDGNGVNGHYVYGCILNEGRFCDIYDGNPCEHLTELPKGDKDNGSSEDK